MNKQIVMNFGNKLKKLRIEKQMSQEALANKIGIHRTYIGSIERGEKAVSLITIEKISKALEISISKLLEGIDV